MSIGNMPGKRIKVTKPVISGMLFVCLSRPELTIVEHAPNVHHFFSKRGTNAPLIIPDQQMADFRFMVDLSDTSILMVHYCPKKLPHRFS